MASDHYPAPDFSPAASDEVDSLPGSSRKRKAESANGALSRSKRSSYISVACNECKRRKIRCNGQQPCQRCGHLSLECVYASNCCPGNHPRDEEEVQHMKAQIANLQDQVNSLFSNLHSTKAQDSSPTTTDSYSHGALSNNEHRRATYGAGRRGPPPLQGPISATYGFDVAKHSLAEMGITPESGVDNDPSDQPSPERPIDPELTAPVHHHKDPLWTFKREEALRLLKAYDQEIGVTYPMLDMHDMLRRANLLWTFIEASIRSGFMADMGLPGADALDDDDTNIMKMTLANMLTFEGNGSSELGDRIFQSVEPCLAKKNWQPADTKGIKLIALASMWFFHQDNELQSWRLIGIAGRMCMELGLHRKASLEKAFPSPEDQKWALALFWAIHSFDRRWSLGTGLPFTIPDADIDPLLPRPLEPYPKAMYEFHRLISKIWYSALANEAEPRREEMEALDEQISQWYDQIEPQLRLNPTRLEQELQDGPSGPRRLRVLVYMRLNSARLSVYRPILHSATTIMAHRDFAQRAVDIAKDTITLLTRVNQVSNLYRTQQVRFNHFLVSALAALFLAVCHAPAEFNHDVRKEFYMALELIRGFSASSTTSRRLWETIRQLRYLFHQVDAFKPKENDDPHSSAAIAMAGLAGQPMDTQAYLNSHHNLSSSPVDGAQMSAELTQLFEIFGTAGTTEGSVAQAENNAPVVPSWTDPANDVEILRILGQIF